MGTIASKRGFRSNAVFVISKRRPVGSASAREHLLNGTNPVVRDASNPQKSRKSRSDELIAGSYNARASHQIPNEQQRRCDHHECQGSVGGSQHGNHGVAAIMQGIAAAGKLSTALLKNFP